MVKKFFQSGLQWLWISVLVIMLDRITKLTILKKIAQDEILRITPFFNLTCAYNKGAAFSFLSAAPGWQVWMFGLVAVIISIILLVWLKRISYREKWLSVALCLIVGGALGNLWDRLSYGQVVDFLQFHLGNLYYPVFNLADSCICVGTFMLVLDAFWKKKT
jgi:signal peptidase II